MTNPFFITGIIPEPYFCDREKETQQLVRIIENKAHILLTSARRMGKTQLIYHVYEQPAIKTAFHTFYVDIFPTTSLHEMVLFLSKEIYSKLVPKGKKALKFFLSTIKSLTGSLGYDPATGTPSFDVKLGDIHNPELTLQEIFNYLEKADKPCIFAIDEFQQITNYPEKNVEALLRTYIQRMNNCLFIFAGSNRHILENMFNSTARPFYNSTEQFHLERIPKEIYTTFAIQQIIDAGKAITPEAASLAYNLFEGHTYYVHHILHNAFANANPQKTMDEEDIRNALEELLEARDRSFSNTMNRLNYKQKETLVAIAKEGKACGVTSVAFVKKHALKSASSVQYAISTLLEDQLLTYEDDGRTKIYSVTDRFLGYWIRKNY
jgi:AAA+ ATPase superfamily predicted ATPase